MKRSISCALVALSLCSGFVFLYSCGGGGGDGGSGSTYYLDADGDGYGDVNSSQVLDSPLAGWVLDSTDCDDDETTVNPGAAEVCDDWIDDDCNALVDCYDDAACAGTASCLGCVDGDLDGYYAVALDCSGGNDCADADSTVNPGVDADGDTLDACQDCDDFNSSIQGGTAEVCDGDDNDCDWQIDEDDPGGGVACDGADTDLCAEGTTACVGGVLTCSDNTGSTLDICNGIDDDCDPASADGDEDPNVGTPCDGPDSDLCIEGVRQCVGGALACSDNTGSTLDICNGVNDDCDPTSVDGSEDPNLGLPCDGPDADLCSEGTYTSCAAGVLLCSDNTSDTLETCNGLDDDCDGQVDEGFAGTDADGDGFLACGDCDDTPGTGASIYPGATELCNGIDDDCDGQTDEPWPELNTVCTVGIGACQGLGIWECTAGGSGTECSAVAGSPSAEVCDGLDNDCDGAVDENNPGGGGSCDTGNDGICSAGTTQCQGGALQCVQDQQALPYDICGNGLDDDCDGTVDGPGCL